MTTIIYQQGAQTIRHAPVDRMGVPRVVSSATYTILDLRDAEGGTDHEVVASTPAVIPSGSFSLTAAAGPNAADPRRLAVASVAGIETDRVYLLQDASSGRQESVRIAGVDAGALELTLTNGLVRDYASGSTGTAIELEGTFPAAVANDEQRLDRGGGPFQVTWVYSIDGELYVSPREIWLTRYGIQPWVTFDRVARHLPGLAQQVGDVVTPEAAIAGATDDLAEHLQASGTWERDPAYFRGNMSAELCVRKWAIKYLLLGTRNEPAIDLARDYDVAGRRHADNLTQGRPTNRSVAIDPIDNQATAGGERAAAGGYFARG